MDPNETIKLSGLVGHPVSRLRSESLRSGRLEHRPNYTIIPKTLHNHADRKVLGSLMNSPEAPIETDLDFMQTTAGLASIIDINDRWHQQEEHLRTLSEQLEFERMAVEISASFVNAAPGEIDQAIHYAQGRIVEALDLDQSGLFHVEGEADLLLTHHWERPGQQPPPLPVSAREQFPWTLAKILDGELACFSSIEEIPDAVERETMECYRIKSRVAVPFGIGGRIMGAVTFASTRLEQQWSEETLNRLRHIAQIFAVALARKDAEVTLRASEERFRTLADNAPVMIWVSDRDRSCTWLNRQWLEFVGRPLEEQLGDGWMESVHPDDLKSCIEVYATACNAYKPFSMEYRRRRHDGVWRWILDKGTPNDAGAGTFEGYIGSCVDVTEQRQAKLQLESDFVDSHRSGHKKQAGNRYLRREVREPLGLTPVVGRSSAIRKVVELVEQVSATDATVLLLGETGTGKELFATLIHEMSVRRARTMVRVNCAAIPATLIESELFGREKGAYTGALTRQIGRFELADHSTIFLDEIGDLPQEVQVKLLRVLEERQIERLGSTNGIHVDVRIIAATHRNLEQRISDDTFRADLFYRLNVFPIQVPPLRERTEDIPLLVWQFVEEFSKSFGKQIETISSENMAALQSYSWPGNIRELRNVVERSMIVSTGAHLTIALPPPSGAAQRHSIALEDVEKEHILKVLEGTGWRIRGESGAARQLGLKPTTLETRMAKLGLSRPKHA